MTFDIKTEWTCPSINEAFLITDNGTPIMKVKCVEGKGGNAEKECRECVWWDTCSKCDMAAGPFPCHPNQRPDGKYVYYVKQEVING